MNERILKIAQDTDAWCAEHYSGKNQYNIDWENKFAEAIVRECAKIAIAIECPIEEGISRQTQGHTWDMACVAAATKIKEHFGVTK